jgi:hypothetical protein
MQNVLLITIPIYDARDMTVLDSVKKAIEEGRPDFLSLSYYCGAQHRCIVFAFNNHSAAEILARNVIQWPTWKKADPETLMFMQGYVTGATEMYEVDGSFESEVEPRISAIEDFIPATLWDTTREG